MSVIYKKVCLIGDFEVGKTSLIRRYIDNQFSDQYLSTIGVKISQKNINLPSHNNPNEKLQLMIWDIEGGTKFQPITQEYLQGLHGAIIVADLHRPDSIEHIQNHMELLTSVSSSEIVFAIVLNKIDLYSKIDLKQTVLKLSQVLSSFTKIKSNKDDINHPLTLTLNMSPDLPINFIPTQEFPQDIKVFTTSAKTGENVEKMFQTLALLLLNAHELPYCS